jgi:hypothetical protein
VTKKFPVQLKDAIDIPIFGLALSGSALIIGTAVGVVDSSSSLECLYIGAVVGCWTTISSQWYYWL